MLWIKFLTWLANSCLLAPAGDRSPLVSPLKLIVSSTLTCRLWRYIFAAWARFISCCSSISDSSSAVCLKIVSFRMQNLHQSIFLSNTMSGEIYDRIRMHNDLYVKTFCFRLILTQSWTFHTFVHLYPSSCQFVSYQCLIIPIITINRCLPLFSFTYIHTAENVKAAKLNCTDIHFS